ncbi:Caleosin related protein-domain-containing protein [Apiospora hydei]|uniref:Caleosin related protein-domain-containing protein n=1 Tax=Apiospora hydei TaxID=1337664 RepID=A0ABR1WD06_9PEZI
MEGTMETYADAVKLDPSETEVLLAKPKHAVTNGVAPPVVGSIPEVPVTMQRKPFLQPEDDERLPHTGTARANLAATYEKPSGTTEGGWAEKHRDQTVLQQHCEFFDTDRDGIIWPLDTFRGFRAVGFGYLLSLLSVVIIHGNFSYPTGSSWLPDPFFRIHLARIHKDKHGSDTQTYDAEGRFVPQKFEDIFAKYAEGRDYLTVWDIANVLQGQRVIMDPIGWFGAFFEWLATYLMLWPEDGKITKEDIRRVYDGSIFQVMADRRAKKNKE